MLQSQEEAATKVQSVYRGHYQRKKVQKLRHDVTRMKVSDYLRKHKIHELFHHMVSLLVFYRPENPEEFLKEEFAKLSRCEKTDLLVDSDLDTMFDMIDITKQGVVAGHQLRNACQNLSVEIKTKIDPNKQYTREEFKGYLRERLQTKSDSWRA
eukprot:Sspe_Gene.89735::Locus_61433_Transcript_1_1_Confidence_1.000_Length_552::g.89735::m.89735